MTKDYIIALAREAGCLEPGPGGDPNGLWEPWGAENVTELMFRFAELLEAKVRADERELLEALEAIMRYPKIREYVGSELGNKADAAIAKARGEK